MEQDRLNRVEEGFDKMREDITDIKTSIAELTQSTARLVEYQAELAEIRKEVYSSTKDIALMKSDISTINDKMTGYKSNFDKLTAKVSEVENSTDKKAYAILKWLACAVGVILVAFVMSKLGFK